MTTRERMKWAFLSTLAIIALMLAFAIPIFAQANPNISPDYQDTKSELVRSYPAPDSCDPYPGPYPDPYPGNCVYIPVVFSNFNIAQLWDEFIGNGQ